MSAFDTFDTERRKFEAEVEREAARLVREGYAAPSDAIDAASKIVLARRRQEQQQRNDGYCRSVRMYAEAQGRE